MKRPPNYVELGCMTVCYALVACIGAMVIRPDLVVALVMGLLP